uniref:Uncharacterized protein n=1 Tax=Arundo donax TaxID=35708 RepID=A0A0A8ZQC3_ARUDO
MPNLCQTIRLSVALNRHLISVITLFSYLLSIRHYIRCHFLSLRRGRSPIPILHYHCASKL